MNWNAKHWIGAPIAAALLASACVTINVYFPAAEAREAARVFIEDVINEGQQAPEAETETQSDGGMAMHHEPRRELRFDPWMLLGIAPAHAQSTPDISIETPAIQALKRQMETRFTSLRPHFDSGALGFSNDGLVVVRDATRLDLRSRVTVNQAVADDNRDRRAVYREVAVANGHPEWESQIRSVFSQQWIASARSGWWYQDAGGNWRQK